MNNNDVSGINCAYGVHDWIDGHGNSGVQLVSQQHIRTRTTAVDSLFETGYRPHALGTFLTGCSDPPAMRKICVGVDSQLVQVTLDEIDSYFAWCKSENLVKDYVIIRLTVRDETEQTWGQVSTIITAAKQLAISRRDLFVAIGSTAVPDIVGFAAAVYRRSTPWIWVPTDLHGIIRCSSIDTKLSVHHFSRGNTDHKSLLTLCHPPMASFYDSHVLHYLSIRETTRRLVEMIDIAVHNDKELFSHLETWTENILTVGQSTAYLGTAVEHASRMPTGKVGNLFRGNGSELSSVKLVDEVTRAIKHINETCLPHDDAGCISTAIALVSALLFHKGLQSRTDLERVLNLLAKTGLPLYGKGLEAGKLFQCIFGKIREQAGVSSLTVPASVGQCVHLDVGDISPDDLAAALLLLHHQYPRMPPQVIEQDQISLNLGATESQNGSNKDVSSEQFTTENTRYHVASVAGIFSPTNLTLVQDYCAAGDYRRKRRVLIVVDDKVGNSAASDIDAYFQTHRSAIETFCIHFMHVVGTEKDMNSVIDVIEAGMKLQLSENDLIIVVGGGTLMDVVGFSASMFRGGIPYIRIPTTLVGMIDAGVGAKVGVDYDGHKSLIGRFYAPVACLNDPEAFLPTLPRREFACGLAESIKMGILKSPRLFYLLEQYHRTGTYNEHTQELMHISIRTMLEELQPNLYEHNLRRLVDFGHEFGHIIESRSGHRIPHGECVAMGIAISSHLSWQKGVLGEAELQRILTCLVDLGLPIYTTQHDSCNPVVLLNKICTDGAAKKDVQHTIMERMHHTLLKLGSGRSKTDGLLFNRVSDNEQLISNPTSYPHQSRIPRTTSIVDPSGDIGSSLAIFLMRNNTRILCFTQSELRDFLLVPSALFTFTFTPFYQQRSRWPVPFSYYVLQSRTTHHGKAHPLFPPHLALYPAQLVPKTISSRTLSATLGRNDHEIPQPGSGNSGTIFSVHENVDGSADNAASRGVPRFFIPAEGSREPQTSVDLEYLNPCVKVQNAHLTGTTIVERIDMQYNSTKTGSSPPSVADPDRFMSLLMVGPRETTTPYTLDATSLGRSLRLSMRSESDKIDYATLDNAENNDTAWKVIGVELGFDGCLRRCRCFGDRMNLSSKALLFGRDANALEEQLAGLVPLTEADYVV
ncbi:putative 3-dehydroquinate synthase [Seiridium unicorne]|uniref:3-dehydroquinate synthase n=1 Tax=Seiridium unicorne TaxID=138068 RepID=A0ABR2VAX4_9PEZI